MEILSKLPERIKEVMSDAEIGAPKLAETLGIKSNTITRYLQGVHQPKLDKLVLLADFFHCSADFLLGLSDYPQYETAFAPTREFSYCFKRAIEHCKVSQYWLQKTTGISWANFHHWLKGERLPYADSLIRLAVAMDISVDFLLGRVT